jgi:hypothetical protein
MGVKEEWSASFLPIEPTQSEFGRPVIQLADDARGVFTGSSLLFLEIEKQATLQSLGDYIGSLTPEGLEELNKHRIPQAGTRAELLVCEAPDIGLCQGRGDAANVVLPGFRR